MEIAKFQILKEVWKFLKKNIFRKFIFLTTRVIQTGRLREIKTVRAPRPIRAHNFTRKQSALTCAIFFSIAIETLLLL